MIRKIARGIKRFVSWLFGAPFRNLPPEFGDTVPPELRVFEAESEEMERRRDGDVSTPVGPVPHHGSDSAHEKHP